MLDDQLKATTNQGITSYTNSTLIDDDLMMLRAKVGNAQSLYGNGLKQPSFNLQLISPC